MKEKLVSVIIPVYNVERFVKDAIESILNQTYKNLEIIIVDDGSIDKTYIIVDSLKRKDNRIQLYRNDKNKKIVKTLNLALSKATGRYIVRMDGDDISMPDRVEKLIVFLEENPEYDLVGCSLTTIDVHGAIIGRSTYFSNENVLLKTLKYTSPVSHIWAARESVYKKLNGYRALSGVEDYDFLLRMTSFGLRYTNLENYYGYYVRIGRKGNTISTLGLRQRKMGAYAHRLFLERKKDGKDSFSIKNLNSAIETNAFSEKLYALSSKFLFLAIRNKKNILLCSFYLTLSLIHPYQLYYLWAKLMCRIIIVGYKKH